LQLELTSRGQQRDPKLAIADGKTVNTVDKTARSVRGRAAAMNRDIYMAEEQSLCIESLQVFLKLQLLRYPYVFPIVFNFNKIANTGFFQPDYAL